MKQTRMVFIGVGHRGSQQAAYMDENFSDRAKIVALADIDQGNLERCAARLGRSTPDLYPDWRAVVARDDVDAVCVSTPQYTHREIVVAACEAGKHVYCEKPMALTVADCKDMIIAGRKAEKVLLVGQQMRYHLHLNRMSQLIDEGLIGKPRLVWLKEFRNPFPSNMKWAFDKSKSGGALVEKSCHHFDVFSWMLRSRAVRVFASGGQAVHKEIYGVKSDIVDHAWVTIEYENGGRAMLGLCFFAGLPHAMEGGVGTHVRDIGVIGDKGMVTTEGFYLGCDLEVHFSDRPDVVRIALDPASGSRDALFERSGNWGIWVDFLRCVQQGGEPVATGEIGLEAVAVALAAEKSIETGMPVAVDSVR
jgi:predicted dehydrogenase